MDGVRDEVDREGVHGGSDGHGVDGIMYSHGWFDKLHVLDIVGGTTIRAISADDVSAPISAWDGRGGGEGEGPARVRGNDQSRPPSVHQSAADLSIYVAFSTPTSRTCISPWTCPRLLCSLGYVVPL